MKSFAELIKGEPSVGAVHATTALGNQMPPRRRYKPFSAFISGGPKKPSDGPALYGQVPLTFGPTPVMTATTKRGRYRPFREMITGPANVKASSTLNVTPTITATNKRYATVADLPATVRGKLKGKKARQWMHVWNSSYDSHGDEARAFAEAWSTVGKQLGTPNAPPFPADLGFLSRLHGPQVPSFLWALTHRDMLPKARVPLNSLIAIQDRIDPKDVLNDEKNPSSQRPTVVKLHGAHYIADGHDRLSARLDEGKTHAKVRLHDIDNPSDPEAIKKASWSTPFKIEKVDQDKQQLFGWASVVTKGGRAIIDKQGDIIPVDELENAAHDFVLSSRKQGDMHSRTDGVGRLIESMVFSAEKQKALGIDLGLEGWWVGFQCDCKELWKDIRTGRKLEFSIGGAAIPEKVAD